MTTRIAEQIPGARMPYPQWRSLLEARWQTRLQEVTELSVAYHDAAAAPALSASGHAAPPAKRRLRQLLRQAVTARRELADTEDALTRLTNGRFGRCEHCASALPPGLLELKPEARYCLRCQPEPAGRMLRHDGQVLDARPVV